mgnify:CR=1 FL=1
MTNQMFTNSFFLSLIAGMMTGLMLFNVGFFN